MYKAIFHTLNFMTLIVCILKFWYELHSANVQQLYKLMPHQIYRVLINREYLTLY